MNDSTCKIAIADDHTLFRNGLRTLLTVGGRYEVVGEAADGAQLIRLLREVTPDVILLDIDMPVMNGIDAAAAILADNPAARIITLSMYGEEDYYFRMVSLGVKGFVLKNSDIDEVQGAIDAVMDGGSYFSQELLFNLVSNLRNSSDTPSADEEELSGREREILLLICKGFSNQEIGDELFISKRTVDKHRANILAKTGCRNTANLVVYAIKNKLVEI